MMFCFRGSWLPIPGSRPLHTSFVLARHLPLAGNAVATGPVCYVSDREYVTNGEQGDDECNHRTSFSNPIIPGIIDGLAQRMISMLGPPYHLRTSRRPCTKRQAPPRTLSRCYSNPSEIACRSMTSSVSAFKVGSCRGDYLTPSPFRRGHYLPESKDTFTHN